MTNILDWILKDSLAVCVPLKNFSRTCMHI